MSKPKKGPDQDKVAEIKASIVKAAETFVAETNCGTCRNAVEQLLQDHRENEQATSSNASVGYSSAYAANYDGIFGNKVGSDLPN